RVAHDTAGKVGTVTVKCCDLVTGRVTQVFTDGMPLEARAPANAAATSMAAGTWTITITTDEGEKPVTLTLQQVGDQLRGTIQGSLGSSQISTGSIGPAGDLQFTASLTMGSGTEAGRCSGTIEGNLMPGTVAVVGHPRAAVA